MSNVSVFESVTESQQPIVRPLQRIILFMIPQQKLEVLLNECLHWGRVTLLNLCGLLIRFLLHLIVIVDIIWNNMCIHM